MNLIGHLACAREHGAMLQLGAVLPDVLGLFARRPRAHALEKHWRANGGLSRDMAGVAAGIRFHHYVDARFHAAPLFRDNAVALRKTLQDASREGGLKRFFAAHILLEMFFDRLLLRHAPALSEWFYTLLERERRGMLERFVSRHPDVDGQAFDTYLGRFLEHRFVEDYLHDEGIIHRADRMLLRMRQRPLNEPEVGAAVSYFGREAAQAEAALFRFVALMQRWKDGAGSHNSGGGVMMGETRPAPPMPGRLPGLAKSPLSGAGMTRE